MAFRTLGTLRAEIIRRLGFGATGASAGVITATIDSFLFSAQQLLYLMHDWDYLRAYYDTTLGVGQYLIDYPTALNPERILEVYANIGGIFTPVAPGIKPEDYSFQHNTSWPLKYERYAQLEVWPKSDAIYTVRIWGIKKLGSFFLDNDVCTMDDNLVFLMALVNAKEHYHQEATNLNNQLQTMLSMLKSKSWTKSVFRPPGAFDDDPMVKPKVI